MKIAIAGIGYVGLSNAVILAQHHEVWAVDLDADKVAMVNRRESPLEDPELEEYLAERTLQLQATLDKHEAYAGADLVVIATPTDYDSALELLRHQLGRGRHRRRPRDSPQRRRS